MLATSLVLAMAVLLLIGLSPQKPAPLEVRLLKVNLMNPHYFRSLGGYMHPPNISVVSMMWNRYVAFIALCKLLGIAVRFFSFRGYLESKVAIAFRS